MYIFTLFFFVRSPSMNHSSTHLWIIVSPSLLRTKSNAYNFHSLPSQTQIYTQTKDHITSANRPVSCTLSPTTPVFLSSIATRNLAMQSPSLSLPSYVYLSLLFAFPPSMGISRKKNKQARCFNPLFPLEAVSFSFPSLPFFSSRDLSPP